MDNTSTEVPQVSITNLKRCSINHNDILNLLKQLTKTPKMNKTEFQEIIKNLPSNHFIFVLRENNSVAGLTTVLIEQKIIHGGGKIAHVEDVVVDTNHRGKGYAKQLINHACNVARLYKCYKIILHCNDDVKPFYEKYGFEHKTNGMALYLD